MQKTKEFLSKIYSLQPWSWLRSWASPSPVHNPLYQISSALSPWESLRSTRSFSYPPSPVQLPLWLTWSYNAFSFCFLSAFKYTYLSPCPQGTLTFVASAHSSFDKINWALLWGKHLCHCSLGYSLDLGWPTASIQAAIFSGSTICHGGHWTRMKKILLFLRSYSSGILEIRGCFHTFLSLPANGLHGTAHKKA